MAAARHPGEFLRRVLASVEMAHGEAATQLGVSRSALARVLAGRASLSADLALRVEAWLASRRDWREGGNGIARPVRARDLLIQQVEYDLAHAEPVEVDPLRRVQRWQSAPEPVED